LDTVKQIPLSQGKFTLVDDSEYEELSKHKWYANRGGKTFYAARTTPLLNGKRKTLFMHRVILNTPRDKQGDHIDGNGLNNQRANLRNCTKDENNRNRHGLDANNTSGYRGVSWDKGTGKFRAFIKIKGLAVHLGSFTTAAEASGVFDQAAKKHYGEFYQERTVRC